MVMAGARNPTDLNMLGVVESDFNMPGAHAAGLRERVPRQAHCHNQRRDCQGLVGGCRAEGPMNKPIGACGRMKHDKRASRLGSTDAGAVEGTG